jgi:formamidopyrimidine-DNA glycosylase
MPEGVEYLKLAQQLHPAWTGNRVEGFSAPRQSPNPKKYLQGDWSDFVRTTTASRIEHISTHGKMLFVLLDSGHTWRIHLSSTGWLLPGNDRAATRAEADPIHANFLHKINSRNVRLKINFEDGQVWHYHDPRTWGKWWLEPPGHPRPEQGPDWTTTPTRAALALIKHQSKRTAKDVLCDQKVAAGDGNYQSVETLWRAGIHPHSRWDRIPTTDRIELGVKIRDFLRDCLTSPDHTHWAVFRKAGQPCPVHPTQPILYAKDGINGKRGSYYCPLCQEKLT